MMTSEKRSKDTDLARNQLLGKVAWLYYHEELTQAEIAEKLGFSRVTVNRLIREAKDSGVVEVKIHTDFSASFELGQELCHKYEIRDAICVPFPPVFEDLPKLLAQAAADVFTQRLQDGMTVGIGIGRTISYLPDFVHLANPAPCRFIGLTGGLDLHQSGVPHTFDTISRLASLTGGTPTYIPAPSYVSDPQAQQVLVEQPAVVSALQMAAGSQLAIFSIGAADYSALLYQFHLTTSQEMEELHTCQAVGDILGRFFDSQGRELDSELNQRIIGLHLEQLRHIPIKILVAGGENKRQALQIALQSRYCDILVTDSSTAEFLLAKEVLLA